MRNKASATEGADLQFCWEQILRIRPQFRLSHPYAPKEIAAGILALHALFASLEEAICGASDEVVSRAKLAWWQQELLGQDLARTQHPIVRMLQRSIEMGGTLFKDFEQLLQSSIQRLDSAAPADQSALLLQCRQMGYYPMRLEFALEPGGEVSGDVVMRDCIAAGLLQLLRESARNSHRAYWWLPLNGLARFGISRSEFAGPAAPELTTKLMTHLYSGILETRSNAAHEKDSQVDAQASVKTYFPRHRHWAVQCILNARLLARLKKLHPESHAREFSKSRPVDAWFAWRAARVWGRREGQS